MKARRITLVAAALASSVSSQTIGEMNGGKLLSACTNGDALQKGYCIGYMVGFRDGRSHSWTAARPAKNDARGKVVKGGYSSDAANTSKCPLPRLPHHQMREIFLNYIEDNPEIRYESAGSVITKSLWAAFPCEANF